MKRVDSHLPVPPPRCALGQEKAQPLLDKESQATLSQRDFSAVNTAIAGAFAPNAALQKALALAANVPRA